MGLREEIKAAIERFQGDSERCALEVSFIVENRLELSGNGWWDDDEKAREYFEKRFGYGEYPDFELPVGATVEL